MIILSKTNKEIRNGYSFRHKLTMLSLVIHRTARFAWRESIDSDHSIS